MAMTEALNLKKITIIFPPGDIVSSVLWDKEKNSTVVTLLTRLCTLRGLSFGDLQVLNDAGDSVDTSKTIIESDIVFVELVEAIQEKLHRI